MIDKLPVNKNFLALAKPKSELDLVAQAKPKTEAEKSKEEENSVGSSDLFGEIREKREKNVSSLEAWADGVKTINASEIYDNFTEDDKAQIRDYLLDNILSTETEIQDEQKKIIEDYINGSEFAITEQQEGDADFDSYIVESESGLFPNKVFINREKILTQAEEILGKELSPEEGEKILKAEIARQLSTYSLSSAIEGTSETELRINNADLDELKVTNSLPAALELDDDTGFTLTNNAFSGYRSKIPLSAGMVIDKMIKNKLNENPELAAKFDAQKYSDPKEYVEALKEAFGEEGFNDLLQEIKSTLAKTAREAYDSKNSEFNPGAY